MIDEADRLLDQSYHGWLSKVLKAAYNRQSTSGVSKNGRFGVHNLQADKSIRQIKRAIVTVFCDHLGECSMEKDCCW